MDTSVTFIHAADLHLDSLFQGLSHVPEALFKEIQESTFYALNRLVDQAIEHQVDFVLLAGDLYDHESQSLKAQIRLRNAFERLAEQDIDVFLSHGNHDFIQGDVFDVAYPSNVHVFMGEAVSSKPFYKADKVQALIYGFSYEKRAVHENKTAEYQVMDETVPFHIGMLHGSVATNTEHDHYAPFRVQDLLDKRMDYWALGHIHKRQQLHQNPPVIYPGNTQGRSRKESGEKGCYLIHLSPHKMEKTFLPLQAIRYEEAEIDITACDSPLQADKKMLEDLPTFNEPCLIYLTIKARQRADSFTDDIWLKEVTDLLNESLTQESPWRYIYRYQLVRQEDEKGKDTDPLLSEIVKDVDNDFIQESLKEVYYHREARKFLTPLGEEEAQRIAESAHRLLDEALRKERAK